MSESPTGVTCQGSSVWGSGVWGSGEIQPSVNMSDVNFKVNLSVLITLIVLDSLFFHFHKKYVCKSVHNDKSA